MRMVLRLSASRLEIWNLIQISYKVQFTKVFHYPDEAGNRWGGEKSEAR